jgi:hypothetical protein
MSVQTIDGVRVGKCALYATVSSNPNSSSTASIRLYTDVSKLIGRESKASCYDASQARVRSTHPGLGSISLTNPSVSALSSRCTQSANQIAPNLKDMEP